MTNEIKRSVPAQWDDQTEDKEAARVCADIGVPAAISQPSPSRLGNVFYWFFCVIAVLFVAATVWKWSGMQGHPANWWDWWVLFTLGVLAAASWSVGRVLRYRLAGS